MKDYNEIALFNEVAKTASFTAAAKSLRLQTSTLSRKIAALESRLGIALFTRTTRKTVLTKEGQKLYARTSKCFEELESAEASLQSHHETPCGVVRITAPVVLGMSFLPKVIAEFTKKYPHVIVDLLFEDRLVDLVGERVDLAIRAGALTDSSLRAKAVGSTQFSLFASSEYLKTHDAIKHPQDLLKNHSCITYHPDGQEFIWELHQGTRKVKLKNIGALRTNTLHMAKALAKEGAGIALMPALICGEELKSRSLVHVLPEWNTEREKHWLVYPAQKQMSPALKIMIPFLIERLTKSLD